MTALLTIHGRKFIEVAEADNWYLPEELSELPDNNVIFEEINKLNLKCEIEIIPKLQQMPKGSDLADLILNL